MKIRRVLAVLMIVVFMYIGQCLAQEAGKGLLLDDFEGEIVSGQTVDSGSGNNSLLTVSVDKEIKQSGAQSLKISYDAVFGGYIYVARGLQQGNIKWSSYAAFSFYMYGTDSKARMAFDIKDAGRELFRFIVMDDFTGWKQIVCPFSEFFVRGDWQPNDANNNELLDFPIKSFQFEPLPVSKGVIYVDAVSLEPLN